MIDASRYEQGIDEFGKLCDEILHYMRETFIQSRDFGGEIKGIDFQLRKDKGKIFLQVRAAMDDEQKVLMEKMLMIVLNKADILADPEVIGEYVEHFLAHAQSYIKHTFGIQVEKNEMPLFLTSAVTQSGIEMRLDAVQHYLQYEREHSSLLLFDVVPVAKKPE